MIRIVCLYDRRRRGERIRVGAVRHGQGSIGDLLTLKQLGKDVGTMVVLAICTTIVFAALILSVYVWHYILAATVVVVAVLALRGGKRR